MADISNIVGYRIVFPGCGWWPNKKSNQSRNKVYCKQYEIELTFDNGKTFKDVMIHGAKGAGRDCYFLQETDLCLKMYPELAYTTNEKEATGSAKFQPLVPMHLPQVVRQRREEVDTHSNKKVLSDTLLVQMVGETLGTRLGKVATKTCDAALQQEMVQWLRDIAIMTENLTRVKLQWNEDFHCENIAWYEKTKTWYVIDLEHWETTTQTCQQQWSAAGKRLLRDMELHRSDAGMFFFKCSEIGYGGRKSPLRSCNNASPPCPKRSLPVLSRPFLQIIMRRGAETLPARRRQRKQGHRRKKFMRGRSLGSQIAADKASGSPEPAAHVQISDSH